MEGESKGSGAEEGKGRTRKQGKGILKGCFTPRVRNAEKYPVIRNRPTIKSLNPKVYGTTCTMTFCSPLFACLYASKISERNGYSCTLINIDRAVHVRYPGRTIIAYLVMENYPNVMVNESARARADFSYFVSRKHQSISQSINQ